jgi:hypothetical protein
MALKGKGKREVKLKMLKLVKSKKEGIVKGKFADGTQHCQHSATVKSERIELKYSNTG